MKRPPRKSHETRVEFTPTDEFKTAISKDWFPPECLDYFAVKAVEHLPLRFEVNWYRPQ